MPTQASPLQQIDPDVIRKNPDNPRLIFREDEMTELMNSIREVGIKVPVSVYPDANRFVLLDGERRWRCAKRLNLTSMPAHVQAKPTRLENLLMMFNIHNVRVDWDPMPMAFKLAEVRDMLQKEGKPNSAKDLAAITGVRLASVRRAFELLELPKHYQKLILKEAEKPRDQQHITPDLFIEIFKSFRAVEKHTPEVLDEFSKTQYTDAMVRKYQSGVIDSVVKVRCEVEPFNGASYRPTLVAVKSSLTIIVEAQGNLDYHRTLAGFASWLAAGRYGRGNSQKHGLV